MVKTMLTYIFENDLNKIVEVNIRWTKVSLRPLIAATGCLYHS